MTVTAVAPPTTAAAAEAAPPKSRRKLVIVLVAVLAIAGGGYWFLLRPAPAGPPQPGTVVKLDPIQVNLAAEHYLRVGIALQLVEGVEEVDGSKALDAAIGVFSGQAMARVNEPAVREKLKKALEKELGERYDHEVMGVYFTEFVTQ